MLLSLVACQPMQERTHDQGLARGPAPDSQQRDPGLPARRETLQTPPTLDIGPANAAGPIRLQVGQALRVHLPASPASGYRWELQEPTALLSIEADPGGDPLTFTRLGSDSRFMSWRFRAKDTGITLLKFRYGRPWETGADSGRTETFHIDVR